MTRAVLLAVACLVVAAAPAGAQEGEGEAAPSVMLVFDASKSMNEDAGGGQTRLEAAQDALVSLIDTIPGDARLGLRVFGSERQDVSRAEGCRDSKLIFPVGTASRGELKRTIRGFDARGRTPIALALRSAADDLPAEGKRTIVLVSDGGSNCAPPEPCDVAGEIAGQGVDLSIQAIGFQVSPRARSELQCIAESGGGSYADAADARQLEGELRRLSLGALRSFAASGRAIQGGPDFRQATRVEPGQYTDAIGPDQVRWYALSLKRGQTLRANATAILEDLERINGRLAIKLYTPELKSDFANEDEQSLSDNTQSVGTRIGPVGDPDEEDLAAAGEYFVRVSLRDPSGDLPPRDVPLELVFEVSGTPQREPSAPGPAPQDDEPVVDTGVAAVPAGDAPNRPLLIAGVAVGLALGAAGGFLLVIRRGGGSS